MRLSIQNGGCKLLQKLTADSVCLHGNGIQKQNVSSRGDNDPTPKAVSACLWHDNDTRNPKLRIPNTFTQGKKDPLGFPTHRPALPPHFKTITTTFETEYHITKWKCASARSFDLLVPV